MLEGNARKLATLVLALLGTSDEPPSKERVLAEMAGLRAACPVTDEEFSAAIKFVEAQVVLSMGDPVVLAPKFEKWLIHRKRDIDPFYWERYRSFMLQQGWGPKVVRKTDEIVDDLLDYCGDPSMEGPWKRRGLVIGNVQSGKTATYIALCNKAADAGYKIFILLAGTLNSLRYQTQERLDEGFVGFDTAVAKGNQVQQGGLGIGVGRYANKRSPIAFTSKAKDFDANLLNVRARLDGLREPALLVVKKNSRILKNLYNWLADINPSKDGKIDAPLLLIDDEADAASVNTGSQEDPRAVNAGIRKLLSLFSRSSYAGFTATPFANIFIAPDSTHEMFDDDLFPRDYIYCLEPPTNYVGPVRMFRDEEDAFVRIIGDADEIFPKRHKKHLLVDRLPESLVDALGSFLVVNAIRDLRGQGATHRSMLVNVSWANDVQHQVADLLRSRLDAIVQDVRAFAEYPTDHALERSEYLRRLKAAFDAEYASLGYSWNDIQHALYESIRAIVVQAVNMSSGTSRLDYDAHKTLGLRVVAVGGNALSRGLTLEGLSTSYIYRDSKAYDTLLQMGRWFGYRPGYTELCRVWMSEEALSWYSHITEATEELRAEVRLMHDLGLTPQQFGLRVRAHPDSLIVTARNKMRFAETVAEGHVSLSMRRVEATVFPVSDEANRSNREATDAFIGTLPKGVSENIWKGISKTSVAELLSRLNTLPSTLQPREVARFLRDTDIPELRTWDVAIASGVESPIAVAGITVRPVTRKMTFRGGSLEIFKQRLASSDDDAIGMSEEQKKQARDDYESFRAKATDGTSTPSLAACYRKFRDRPLLIIYFVKPNLDGQPLPITNVPLVTVGISFPRFEDTVPGSFVVYEANRIWQQMKLDVEADTDEDPQMEADADER